MKNKYKIAPEKISKYTKRINTRVLKKLLLGVIIPPPLILSLILIDKLPKESVWVILVATLSTILIMGMIYLNNKKLTRLTAENYKVIIDNKSISKIIDLDNEPRMNYIHKYLYQQQKITSDIYNSKIDFINLKSIEIKKGDLWVKSTNSNAFNGKNIIVIPREIENFDKIQNELQLKLNK